MVWRSRGCRRPRSFNSLFAVPFRRPAHTWRLPLNAAARPRQFRKTARCCSLARRGQTSRLENVSARGGFNRISKFITAAGSIMDSKSRPQTRWVITSDLVKIYRSTPPAELSRKGPFTSLSLFPFQFFIFLARESFNRVSVAAVNVTFPPDFDKNPRLPKLNSHFTSFREKKKISDV